MLEEAREGRKRRGDSDSPATEDNECIRRRRDMLQFPSVSSFHSSATFRREMRFLLQPSSSLTFDTAFLFRLIFCLYPDYIYAPSAHPHLALTR